jgi:hypothetical protein
VYTGFSWRNLRERDNFETPGIDGRAILKWIFKKGYGIETWTGLILFRIGAGGELL